MSKAKIWYRKRRKFYKYALSKEYAVDLDLPLPWLKKQFAPGAISIPGFVLLEADGWLTIRRGYSWDGPSGPTIDTKNSMRASLVHDVLYQLLREGRLPQSFRKQADQIYRRHLLEDGMSRARARMQYVALRAFGGRAARRRHPSASLSAP